MDLLWRLMNCLGTSSTYNILDRERHRLTAEQYDQYQNSRPDLCIFTMYFYTCETCGKRFDGGSSIYKLANEYIVKECKSCILEDFDNRTPLSSFKLTKEEFKKDVTKRMLM